MSASNAPTYYFTEIGFNSSFYNTISTGGLTQAQANALYLQKTTADTATAIESFNAGIYVNTIDSLTNTGTISIGTVRNETGLTLGKTTYSTVINSNTLTPLKVSNIDVAGTIPTSMNIGLTNTNSINLGTVNTTQVNIGTSSNSFSNINLNGTVYAGYGVLTLAGDIGFNAIIDNTTGGGYTMNIGPTNAFTINCGANTIPTNILGQLQLTRTNPQISINGNVGTSGQVLTSGGSGALSWTTVGGGGTTIQSGETGVLSSTSGVVVYSSTFASKPKVNLSFNTNGTTVFIPIGVISHQTSGSLYIGFTWASASTSATATITWYATI